MSSTALPAVNRVLVCGFAAATLVVACSGTSATTDISVPQSQRPPWFRQALEESRETMEVRCDDLAPLELVHSNDPMYEACVGEASAVAAGERQAEYEKSLQNCLSSKGSRGCCFSRVTDNARAEAAILAECHHECVAKLGLDDVEFPRDCRPAIVSPVRSARSRAHTPAVEKVLDACTVDEAAATVCTKLPSIVERKYCENACVSERGLFNAALQSCVRGKNDVSACANAPPRARQRCEEDCRKSVPSDRTFPQEDLLQHGSE